jgi:hypothetical protein
VIYAAAHRFWTLQLLPNLRLHTHFGWVKEMPRDLSSLVKEDTLSGMQPLNRSSHEEDTTGTKDNDTADTVDREPPMTAHDESRMFKNMAKNHGPSRRDELHPYTQTINLSNVDSCVLLEEAAFPPAERATREKVSLPYHCTCARKRAVAHNAATLPSL